MPAAGGPIDDAAVPTALRERVRAALAARGAERPSADACLAAGGDVLDAVCRADPRSRGTALDLLAADALVTLAFELAADDPTTFEATAARALRDIAGRAPGPCA